MPRRSAITGEYVTKDEADASPDTTVSERKRRAKKSLANLVQVNVWVPAGKERELQEFCTNLRKAAGV